LTDCTDAAHLHVSDYEALLSALADVVIDEHLQSGRVTVRVGHGLPDSDLPLTQPELGEWWRVRVDAKVRERVGAGVSAVAAGQQDSWMDEYSFRWSDNTEVHVVHRAFIRRDADGHPVRLIHVFNDATARRQSYEHLLAEHRDLEERVAERTRALSLKNAELARAAQHKDDFLASMSHELRTPLNAVIGLTDALLEGVGGPLADRQRGWLVDIASSGAHLLGLINDILDLARIEAGHAELDLQRVDLADLAESVSRLIAGAALARKVHLVSEVAPDVSEFTSDPRFLRQILLNLLGNAVKFTPPGGRIAFRVHSEGRSVVFEVEDTGIGVPAERLADIFQPFLQLDAGLDREAGGTGLGLALVSRMTERLGGAVHVVSESGKGSTFTVRVPSLGGPARDSGETSGPVVELASVPSPRALHVLLAEDNAGSVRTFTEYLTAKGLQVEAVADGEAAVAAARARRPDVILMDIQMPRMDGLQAMRLIRSEPMLRGVPIIALTALCMPGDRERCLAAGANLYLAKPVRFRELVGAIRSLALQLES
jgi:signal transduction histidine kinase/ActR/RegA family two-component response regulator